MGAYKDSNPVIDSPTVNADRPKSKFYLKVGVNQEFYVPSTDNKTKAFIALPQPLYLDGMKKNQINGESEYATQLACGNSLLEALLKKAETLKPGEEITTKLEVRIYRRKEEVSQTADVKFDNLF